MSVVDASVAGIIIIGLLHGLEPAHGWPLAMLYSCKTTRPTFFSFVSSALMTVAHFSSSIMVAVIYILAQSYFKFSSPILTYVAVAILIVLAIRMITEKVVPELQEQHGHFHDNSSELTHEHEHTHQGEAAHTHMHTHPKRLNMNLRKLTSMSFVLGFAHEEEFALLALAVGGVSPVLMMTSYGVSVAAGLIGVTILSVKMYEKVKGRISRYEKYIPKISGVILLIMAAAILIGFT
jgi:nickel/cobalt transporter (NicO) family protein